MRCRHPAGTRRLMREQRAFFARAKSDAQRNAGFLLNAKPTLPKANSSAANNDEQETQKP